MSQQMLLHVLSCLFSWDIFVQETLNRSSYFVRNCKLQQVQIFWRSKNLFWFYRVSVEKICLCGLCWWTSCNDGIALRLSITSNVEALTPVCFLRILQKHEFDTRTSIPSDCNLALERKRSKPRFCDEGWNKVLLKTESKRVLVLH